MMRFKVLLLFALFIGLVGVWWKPLTTRAPIYYNAWLGKPEAQFELSRIYFLGNSEADKKRALELLEKAAEQNNENAIYELTDIYAKQLYGVPRDLSKSFYYLKKAAQFNKPVALYVLGLAYASGAGTTEDHEEAFRWFKKAADAGYPASMYETGLAYMEGRGIPQDYAQAKLYFEKSRNEEPRSSYALATLYRYGYGVQKDLQKSQEYLEDAALKNVPEATYSYARYLDNEGKTESDWLKAGQMYVVAKNEGIKYAETALNQYAYICRSGEVAIHGINPFEVGNTFPKSCLIVIAENDPTALYFVGKYHFEKQPSDESFGYIKHSANLTYVPAMVFLIQIYNGVSPYRDACSAYAWATALEKLMNIGVRKIEILTRDQFVALKGRIFQSLEPKKQQSCQLSGEAIFKSLTYENKMIY